MAHPANRFRSSTLGWLGGTLAGWGTGLLFAAGLVGTVMAGGGALDVPPGSPLILSALALAILAWRWLGDLATNYELTDDRLMLHKGILLKSIDEIELYRVKDVRLDYSIVNQLTGIGTLTVTSSDETTRQGALAIRNVAHARQRREQLRTLVDAARQQRGVREIDMAHEDA